MVGPFRGRVQHGPSGGHTAFGVQPCTAGPVGRGTWPSVGPWTGEGGALGECGLGTVHCWGWHCKPLWEGGLGVGHCGTLWDWGLGRVNPCGDKLSQ